MLSESRLITEITLKSILAIVGLLLFAGLLSKVSNPSSLPAARMQPTAMAMVMR